MTESTLTQCTMYQHLCMYIKQDNSVLVSVIIIYTTSTVTYFGSNKGLLTLASESWGEPGFWPGFGQVDQGINKPGEAAATGPVRPGLAAVEKEKQKT